MKRITAIALLCTIMFTLCALFTLGFDLHVCESDEPDACGMLSGALPRLCAPVPESAYELPQSDGALRIPVCTLFAPRTGDDAVLPCDAGRAAQQDLRGLIRMQLYRRLHADPTDADG